MLFITAVGCQEGSLGICGKAIWKALAALAADDQDGAPLRSLLPSPPRCTCQGAHVALSKLVKLISFAHDRAPQAARRFVRMEELLCWWP